MADDLIIKFFQKDLTEAEEKALSDILASSTEDAQRFFQHAEAAYHFCGLPEPVRKGTPPSGPGPGFGIASLAWFLLFTASALVGTGWWFKVHGTFRGASMGSLAESPDVHSTDAQLSREETPSLKTAPSAGGKIEVKKEESPASDPVGLKDRSVRVEDKPITVASLTHTSPIPTLAPVDMAAQPHLSHSNLSVVLRRRTPGQVTIRILDPGGVPILLLYQGLLQTGTWSFDWDGKLGDGRAASPGKYQIQVQSGPLTQVKNIRIH